MSRGYAVEEERYVVEVSMPVPADEVGEVAERIAERLRMDAARVLKLVDRRTGPVTKPLARDKADAIADTFEECGVAVVVRPAHEGDAALAEGRARAPAAPSPAPPAAVPTAAPSPVPSPPSAFMSSTRWVPSPHDDFGLDPGADDEPPPDETVPQGTPAYTPPPRERGTDMRTYLLVGLGVSLVLLLVLQSLNAQRMRRLEPTATVEAGMEAYRGGDFAAARRVWQPLAGAGDPRAQYMLGYMAENGQGQPWSNRQAADYYGRAASQGLPEAELALGSLYLRGMGVERDPARAAALFRQAAEAGYGPGQQRYAMALFQGEGVPQDFAAALRWFRAAADNGVAEARAYVRFAQEVGGGEPDAAQP